MGWQAKFSGGVLDGKTKPIEVPYPTLEMPRADDIWLTNLRYEVYKRGPIPRTPQVVEYVLEDVKSA